MTQKTNKPTKRRITKESISNRVYQALIGHCEDMEAKKIYKGNGHHLAQRLTRMVEAGLLSRQQRKIYSAVEHSFLKTRDIAEKCGLTTKVVSVQLSIICTTTDLLTCSKEPGVKVKLWKKAWHDA